MRRLASYSFVLVSLLIGISILSTVTPAQTDWRQILIPPLHSFQPKQPKRIQLPNGMVIFLQEDRELPLIDGTARVRGGSREEPASKVAHRRHHSPERRSTGRLPGDSCRESRNQWRR